MSEHTVNFENNQIGAAPEGWTATLTGKGDPKWTVESDETAPSRLKVLKQSGRATYPLLLKNDTNIKDGFVEVRFKAIAGSQDRAGGVVGGQKMRTAITCSGPTPLRTISFSTRPSMAFAVHLTLSAEKVVTAFPFRSQPTPGTACVLISQLPASKRLLTESNYLKSTMPLSPMPGRWGCGQRPTV